jgi:hypothetical protein
MVGHQVNSVCPPADGVGAPAGCRVVEVAEAGGDVLEDIEMAGMPNLQGGCHRSVVCASGGEVWSFLSVLLGKRFVYGRVVLAVQQGNEQPWLVRVHSYSFALEWLSPSPPRCGRRMPKWLWGLRIGLYPQFRSPGLSRLSGPAAHIYVYRNSGGEIGNDLRQPTASLPLVPSAAGRRQFH